MKEISFSKFIENTEVNLSKSYYPLGGFNPGSENYGVLNEVNQANLEKAYKGKITNSTVYIDQVETNWLMQFVPASQAIALRILYSEVLMDAKQIQMQEVKRMGKDPKLLADLSRPEGFEVWEESLAVLKDHVFNPTDEFKTINKQGDRVIPPSRGYKPDFNFGDLPTGVMYLIDKLERPVNTTLLRDLENEFGSDPEKAREKYKSEKNPQRGVCGYNLYHDPNDVNKGQHSGEAFILKDFQTMKQTQANDIISSYRGDIGNGLMGSSATIGDIDVATQFKNFGKSGSPKSLPRYQMDFEGNFYINETGSQHINVLDIETIESLVESGHPSFKNIEITSQGMLRGEPKKIPIDKRTGKEFWPNFMPNGFSTTSSSVRNARRSNQDLMGVRQDGTFVAVDIPKKGKIQKYIPESGKCHAQVLEKLGDVTGKVGPDEMARLGEDVEKKLKDEVGSFEESLNNVQVKLIDAYFARHISVNRPSIALENPDGKIFTKRISIGKGSGYSTMGGATSGNVTETNPLDPTDPDSVLLSNIMNDLIIYKNDKTVGQVVFDGWLKDPQGEIKDDFKGSPELKDMYIRGESKYVGAVDDHVLYFNAGTPSILSFLEGVLKALRSRMEEADNYVLNALNNDKTKAEEAIKDDPSLKKSYTKAYATARSKALSYLNSIVQEGLDDDHRIDGKKNTGKYSQDRGLDAISSGSADVEEEATKKGIPASADQQHEAWTHSVADLINLVDSANKNRTYPEGLEIKEDEVLWFPWVVNKFKEKIGIEGRSDAIEKMSNSEDYKEFVLNLLNSADPNFETKLSAIVAFSKNPPQQQQQQQQPQQTQQQTPYYQIPPMPNDEMKGRIITDGDLRKAGIDNAEKLRNKLNDFFAMSKITDFKNIGDNIYNLPFFKKAIELGLFKFPGSGFEERPEPEEIINMQGKENREDESTLYASKDDLISILSESNGERIFETIKEQLALRKDVCEIIASVELKKQRINQ